MTIRAITSFSGEYRFLSNFWPVDVILDGKIYPSTEHAYQAAKTLDPDERRLIRIADTAGKAKRLGRKVTLRDDWEEVKLEVMEDLQRQKFGDYLELRKLLISTADAKLVEGNTWGDTFWGVCEGLGENHLGRILMKVRDDLNMKGGLEAFFGEG